MVQGVSVFLIWGWGGWGGLGPTTVDGSGCKTVSYHVR